MENEIRNIGKEITQHLRKKKDHKDDLEGIVIFFYKKELKNLSDEILSSLADLLSKGIIAELKNSSGQKCYQLSDD